MEEYINDYNKLIEIYRTRGWSFKRRSRCPKINLTIHRQQELFCCKDRTDGEFIGHNHKMINLYTLARNSYMACVTLKDGSHIHDILPIMIGSELDKEMHENEEYNDNEKLNGLFLIEGIVVIFPFIYTNHRENVHQDFKTGEMIVYLYDEEKQGYKIYEQQGNIILRTPDKVEYNVFEDKLPNIDYLLMDYIDLKRQKTSFDIFKQINPNLQSLKSNIDSFKNKILIHPLSLIERAMQMAIKCHVDGQKKNAARDVLISGNIERLVSKNIQFSETRGKNGNYSKSYGYRKLQPTNISRPNKHLSILRPTPKNVPTTSTLDSYGFICLVEKNTSLDAHTKTLCGIPGSKTLSFVDVYSTDLKNTLDCLFKNGCLTRNYNEGVPLLLNGGLCSKFNITWPVQKTLLFIKKNINQYIEVVYEENFYCMLSLVEGLTFIKYNDLFVTTREANLYFPEYTNHVPLFGSNVYQHVIEDGGYLNVGRLMSGVNYSKNRFSSIDNLGYFTTTNENSCVYITDDRFDKKTDTLKTNVIFSSHPQLCADGVIVDKERPVTATIITRSRFEMDIPPEFYYQHLDVKEPMIEYDEIGNVLSKIYPIAKLQKRGKVMNINIFKQNKFFYTTLQHADACTYYLYKDVDGKEILAAQDTSLDVYSTKTKLYIDFYTKTVDTAYDGLKLSDQCAQKGLAMNQDVSLYKERLGYTPQVVMSLSSILGRTPIHQCKMLLRNAIPTLEKDVIAGEYNFDVLKNAAFTMLTSGKIKFDSQMKSVLGVNGMIKTGHEFEKKTLSSSEIDKFLPLESESALTIINVLKTFTQYKDETGNVHDSIL